MTRFPFTSFPNGWFKVAYSDELTLKKVIPLHYFGKDLVLFRTEDGISHMLDAHCPHLGAHLGYGGQVNGSTIQCPFHGWCFNSLGSCVEIPYTNKIPPKAQIHSWPIREVNGVIMVYYDAKGKSPTWEMPELSQRNLKEYTHFKRYSWKIRTHNQEIVENSVDAAHLPSLHKYGEIKSVNVEKNNSSSFINTISFNVGQHNRFFMRFFRNNCNISMKVCWDGMGRLFNDAKVNIGERFQINILSIFFTTPIDAEYVELSVLFSIRKVFGKLFTSFLHHRFFQDAIVNVSSDIPLWENKVYREIPLLRDNDGPVMQVRSWAEQFYEQEDILKVETSQKSYQLSDHNTNHGDYR